LAAVRASFAIRELVVRFALGLLALLALPWIGQARAAQTVVSFTFDDGIKTQADLARPALAAHGMHGTFYMNSGNVGANSYYMNWSQVDGLAADGNEIGGHTLTHQKLTNLTADQQKHQVCDDRIALQARGYTVTDFAYPYGAGGGNATTRQIVKDCGYTTARKVGGIRDASDCNTCPYAEKIPPADALAVIANPYVTGPMTLAKLQGWVTQAEQHGGGWVVLMFHDICNGCYDASVSQSDFNALLDWLQPRAAQGTVVKTVREALNTTLPPPDTTPPTTSISCNGGTCPATALSPPVTVSLSASDGGGSGVASTRYTTDGSNPTTTSPAYTAPFQVSSTTTIKYRSWDVAGNVEQVRSQTVTIGTSPPPDTTPPNTSITCNGASCPATTLSPPVTINLSATDTGSGVAATRYTTDGMRSNGDERGLLRSPSRSRRPRRSSTARGTWRATPSRSAPRLVNVGSSGGGGPSVTITSPAAGATVRGTIQCGSLNATGVGSSPDVDLYVDGQFTAWRSNNVNPYTIPWNTGSATVGSHSLKVWVTDSLGVITKSAAIIGERNAVGAGRAGGRPARQVLRLRPFPD
jgi:peptidoglycan/xylan/chitin deacetylase (PgdA/CDA1 family)